MNNYTIFDIEADNLLENVTKIHCLSYYNYNNGVITKGSITDYVQIISFLSTQEILIGHNIIRYDVPVLEKLLNIKIKSRLIDTLGISWYLYPLREKHGLELWGDDLGVEKPKIADWSNLSIEEYINRCEKDVEINTLLWNKQLDYLQRIYLNRGIDRILGYITFKLDCAREQEEIKWKLDVELCQNTLNKLLPLKDEKFQELVKAMPLHTKYKKALKPKVMYKKDGNLSEAGKKWVANLNLLGLPLDYSEDFVKIPDTQEPGNPDSPAQLKDWLFSLGWKPCTFSYVKNKEDNSIRKIPQIYVNGELTESTQILIESNPVLENLAGLSVITHRIGILEGFLKNKNSNNMIKAEIKGFTNTMRFQHSTTVNLPSVHKPYGKEIRSCILPSIENHIFCGSDMSSLEDNTKQHYMYFYDPKYVTEMRVPGFDPHLDIAVLSGMLTPEQVQAHKDKKEDYSKIRGKAKTVNFACVYGAGPPKISLSTGMSLEEATLLHKTYWERNKAVKQIANKTTYKIVDNQMWLWNPVSQFWYSLRYEKDKFSVLNQGTGCYVFDLWLSKVRKKGIKITLQMHDEILFSLLPEEQEIISKKLLEAIKETNNEVKLNVDLGISIDYGKSYAQVH